tara:strand:+ start:1483 stop:2070 length:588 start_codon:yes stop_codon:yes gene_type:complete
MFKRAAMFGLDTRITLIIFMSISAIGFASFYSSLNSITATQYSTDMKSVIQAYQNFKNDTGYKITEFSNPYYYNISQLVSLPIDGSKPYTIKFKGPYIDYKLTGANNLIESPSLGGNLAIVSRSYSNSWTSAAHPGTAKCADTDCFKWLVFINVPKAFAEEIDLSVDGSTSPDTGGIRLKANGSNYDVFMPIEAE